MDGETTMTSIPNLLLKLGLLLVLTAAASPAPAQETVTIPKARLTELERKEKELEALKLELGKARGETERLQRAKEQAEREKATAEAERARALNEQAKIEREKAQLAKAKEAAEARAAAASAAAQPVLLHDTPALATLPPLKRGDVVDALDLMNHYRADASGAEQRYGRQRIRVRGVVTGFEKPMFVSHYFIFLRTTERSWRVQCAVSPPREFKATYPAQHGETLVGVTTSEARITLARVGQTVEIEGNCRGLKEQTVTLGGCQLLATE